MLVSFVGAKMIINCKLCGGSGRHKSANAFADVFDSPNSCPVCKGAGELVLPGPAEHYVLCKMCQGKGGFSNSFLDSTLSPCPSCKGAGSLTRPVIHQPGQVPQEVDYSAPPRPRSPEWDFALSFAGEDRRIVEDYANLIKTKKLRVFLDSDNAASLWGEDLYAKLDEIYRLKALYCVMFVSKHYAENYWTNHERQSDQARAFKENRAYIRPVRLDDTEIPGLRETVGYVDLRKTSLKNLADITNQTVSDEKVKNKKSG